MERTRMETLAHRVRTGEELSDDDRKRIAGILMALMQAKFEMSGGMFITGYGGALDASGLPDYVLVAPTYGADVGLTTAYKKAA